MTTTPAIPGAINVTAPLTGNEIVSLGTSGPQSAQTTVAAIASLGSTGTPEKTTTIATVGNGTLTATALAGRIISRSGPTGAYTDTTATAAEIFAAIPGAVAGTSFEVNIKNNTAFAQTLSGGTGVSMSAANVVPANSVARYLVTINSATTATFFHISTTLLVGVTPAQFNTAALSVGTLAAGLITGAAFVVLQNTGATPGAQTTRTAAQMLADFPQARVGMSYVLRIVNTGAGTLTLTADASVTITGTATVAQNVFRDYIVTFATATTATIQDIGAGTSP